MRSALLIWLLVLYAASALPVFPGAIGWGSETRAAYGGQVHPVVYKITNLNASGSGSLEACIRATVPRVCVFEISGTIRLTRDLVIGSPYITIAGQTAPPPGIMIRGAALGVVTHDVLIQHIRVRAGNDSIGPSLDNRDCLKIDNNLGTAYNIVIDHCSFSWGVDEDGSIYRPGAHNISITNSIFSEGLYIAGHTGYPPGTAHSKGLLIGPEIHHVSVARTLFAHNDQRNIKVSTDAEAEYVNNVVYNWGSTAVDIDTKANVIGSVFIPGRNTTRAESIYLRTSGSRVYAADNINAPSGNSALPVASVWIYGSDVLSSSDTPEHVLANAGAKPSDAVDRRIIDEVRTRSGKFINHPSEAGGWPVFEVNRRNLTVPANPHNVDDRDGYTNLEEWLHGFFLESFHPADADRNGCVETREMLAAVGSWISSGISMAEVIDSIRAWKSGC